MAKVEIYSMNFCPYCKRAKALFDSLKIPYTEIDVTNNDIKMQELTEKTGVMTVPQIFIDGTFVGGCDDVMLLQKSGELKTLLEQNEKI